MQFFNNLPYNFVAIQVAGKIALFARFFCWQQGLASILIGLFCLVPICFPAFFCWHHVLTASSDWFILTCSYTFFRVVLSFDLLILLSVTLVIGQDVRHWPGYETLLGATPPKLNTSSNVFRGTNSCEQVVWIYF